MFRIKAISIILLVLTVFATNSFAQDHIDLCATVKNDKICLCWRNNSNQSIAEYSVIKEGVVVQTINNITMTEYQDKDIKTNGAKYQYHITAITYSNSRLFSDTVTVSINNGRKWSALFLPVINQKSGQNTLDKFLLWSSRVSLGSTFITAIGTEIATENTKNKMEDYINSRFESNAFQNWKEAYDREQCWGNSLKWSLISYGGLFVINFIKNGIIDPPKEINIDPPTMKCESTNVRCPSTAFIPGFQIDKINGSNCYKFNAAYHF